MASPVVTLGGQPGAGPWTAVCALAGLGTTVAAAGAGVELRPHFFPVESLRRLPPLTSKIRSFPDSLSWGRTNDGRRRLFGVLPPLPPPIGNTCMGNRKHFFYVKSD
jgi:hypothetical protein